MSTVPPNSPSPSEALRAAFSGLMQDVPGLVSDRVALLSLELDRAGLALVRIALLGMALLVLGLGGWLLLWRLVTTTLVVAGWHWAVALIAALLVHGLLGWWVVHRIRRLLPTLGLPATRRRLMFNTTAHESAAHDDGPHDTTSPFGP